MSSDLSFYATHGFEVAQSAIDSRNRYTNLFQCGE